MALNLVFFIGIFLVGLAGGYSLNIIIKRFPSKFRVHLEELKKEDPHYKRKLYQDISKESYSLSYVGGNTPRFLLIILFTSVLEVIIVFISKRYVDHFSFFLLMLLAFSMVLRLPLLIEFFVRANLHEANNMSKAFRKSGMQYRTYVFRIRPFVYGVALLPLLILLII